MFSAIDKFIVAALGLAVTVGLFDEGVAQTIAAVLTPILVYLVPNKGTEDF